LTIVEALKAIEMMKNARSLPPARSPRKPAGAVSIADRGRAGGLPVGVIAERLGVQPRRFIPPGAAVHAGLIARGASAGTDLFAGTAR
jgi:hypothetical protein